LVAAFLVLAALSKAYVLWTDELVSLRSPIPAWLTGPVIVVELTVAIVLLRRGPRSIKYLGIVGLFAIFLAAKAWQWLAGVPDCGCLGDVNVSSATLTGINVFVFCAACVLLAHSFPGWRRLRARCRNYVTTHARFLGLATGCVLATAIALGGDDFEAVIGRVMHGPHPIVAEPVEMETLAVDETGTAVFELVNRGDESVRLVGASSSCQCLLSEDVSGDVPPNSTRTLTAYISPATEGWYRQSLKIYLSSNRQPYVVVHFFGLCSEESVR